MGFLGKMRVSSSGKYFSISGVAVSGMMTYLVMVDLFSGTRVKILSELKSRSFNCISLRMAGSDFNDTA